MNEKRLYIVRVEFEFPAMLTEMEAAMERPINDIVQEALGDMGDDAVDQINEVGPRYLAPRGYREHPDALIYGTSEDMSWRQAVDVDKAAAAKERP